ncbi:MAG: metallophosphoesterase [Candidatus Competibacteraceae bacterium]
MAREELSKGIKNFLSKNYIGDLQEKFSEYDSFIFFDKINCELTIDDPQLAFYLQNTSVRSLYKFGGKFPDKYQTKSAKYSSDSKKKLIEKPDRNIKHRASYNTKIYTEVTKSINNIKILHLSDIHLSTRNQAELYLSQLKADLIQELKVSKLDYVVISGDIANCSKSEEYDAATLIIDGLINQFSLDSSKFIIVPGNHDLNWDLSKNAYPFKYKDSLPKPLIEGSYIPAGDTGALLREENLYKKRFDYFRNFYRKICGNDFPVEYADQAVLHIYPKDKMIFLALNSCWEIDHYYKNRASINSSALARTLDKIVLSEYQDWLKIAVWHHPINGTESMNDSFIERLAIAGFKIGMHGHIHEARDSYLMYDVNRGTHIIGSGTFGAPIKEQVPGIPLQYNLILFNRQKHVIIVETRKKEKPEGSWSADARWGDKNNPVPRYIIQLEEPGWIR